MNAKIDETDKKHIRSGLIFGAAAGVGLLGISLVGLLVFWTFFSNQMRESVIESFEHEAFQGAQRRADRQNAQAQIGLLRGALERYAMDTKSFPVTEQGLQALVSQPSDSEAGPAASWDGPYLSTDAIPRDPWGNEYQYVYPPERNPRDFPDIWSFGPDGEDNTDDDITNWRQHRGESGDNTAEDLDIEVDVEF